MTSTTPQAVADDAAIGMLVGTVALMGLSALLSELSQMGNLSPQSRLRIRAFIERGIADADVPERTKSHVRSLLRAHFPAGK